MVTIDVESPNETSDPAARRCLGSPGVTIDVESTNETSKAASSRPTPNMIEIPTFGEYVDGVDYKPRPGSYAIVIREDGLIATVRTPKGLFLPGGAVEPGETPEQAATRETEEETGLIIRITRHLGRADELVYKRSSGKYFRKECEFFLAEVLSSAGVRIEDDHVLEWHPRYDAERNLTHQSQVWALDLVSESGEEQ